MPLEHPIGHAPLPRCQFLNEALVSSVIRAAEAANPEVEGTYSIKDATTLEELMAPPPPGLRRLRSILTNMTGALRTELVALMYLGRGDAGESIEHWDDLLGLGAEESDDVQVELLEGKAPLARYLRRGLDVLSQSGGMGARSTAGPDWR